MVRGRVRMVRGRVGTVGGRVRTVGGRVKTVRGQVRTINGVNPHIGLGLTRQSFVHCAPPRLCPHYCNSIARPLCNVRPPPPPPPPLPSPFI